MKFLKDVVAIIFAGIAILLYLNNPLYASAQTNPNENSIGYLDAPFSEATLKGTHNVRGWFLDVSGVKIIEVLVDGAVVGQASYGDPRPDVHNVFPQFNNGTAGFHYTLDTTQFSDGQHTITIRSTGNNGQITTLPDRIFSIENTIGFLDTPAPELTLKGIQNVRGWFLDVSGVKNIEVLVDDAVVGQATYGDPRPDVQEFYPQFNNGTAGFHYNLDTTQFSDGQHTLTIRVTRNNGHVITLLNRTITLENTKGFLDTPIPDSTIRGTHNLRGWFLDLSGVKSIEVLVDDAMVGQATYGDPRPDVKSFFPQFNNGTAGFHYNLDTTQFTDGLHTVTIRSTGNNGLVTTLPNRTIKIENNIGFLDAPISGSIIRGTHNIRGWFLNPSGVSNIDILVDGAVVGQGTYGEPRPDVQEVFPEFNNKAAGFSYALDTTKLSDGQHTIIVRITGNNGDIVTLPEKSITIENNIGFLDNPVSGSTLRGTQNVYGWFLNPSGIANIEVLLDGTVVGHAIYGDARPDVKNFFPELNNGTAGFHYAFDTTRFSDGQHTVTIRVTGNNGNVMTLPERTISIENNIGFIDNPVSGSILNGTQNVYGWFLNPFGVSNIEVLVDGAVVGHATYGDSRPDVKNFFPEYMNGTSGFSYDLDTTRFSNGHHTITIRITGNNGYVLTMPSRTVTFKQANRVVFLDPGHGGSDPGAVSGGYRESDLNLAVAKKVQALLVGRGFNVVMSRSSDTYVGLYDRPQMANNLAADIFVSIHTNSTGAGATSATGIESYYYKYDPNYPSKINGAMHNNPDRIIKSVSLTSLIQENMVSYTGANDRGTKGDTLAVIRESAMPATLLELGFINNASERQKLFTDSYQNTLAKAIADGIDEYFRIY